MRSLSPDPSWCRCPCQSSSPILERRAGIYLAVARKKKNPHNLKPDFISISPNRSTTHEPDTPLSRLGSHTAWPLLGEIYWNGLYWWSYPLCHRLIAVILTVPLPAPTLSCDLPSADRKGSPKTADVDPAVTLAPLASRERTAKIITCLDIGNEWRCVFVLRRIKSSVVDLIGRMC